jgi:hypothetical protein
VNIKYFKIRENLLTYISYKGKEYLHNSSIMSSPPKFILTSSSSQPSRLGDSLVLGNTGVGLVRNGLPVEITQQSEDIRAYEVAIEEQKRAKQICNADRERFRKFYDDELQRKRPKQFLYRERSEGDIESNKAAQEKLRARQV